jgi:hypothetical protein
VACARVAFAATVIAASLDEDTTLVAPFKAALSTTVVADAGIHWISSSFASFDEVPALPAAGVAAPFPTVVADAGIHWISSSFASFDEVPALLPFL